MLQRREGELSMILADVAHIETISHRRRNWGWLGTIPGIVIIVATAASGCDDDLCDLAWLVGSGIAGIGAASGVGLAAIVDSMTKEQRHLYSSPMRAPEVNAYASDPQPSLDVLVNWPPSLKK